MTGVRARWILAGLMAVAPAAALADSSLGVGPGPGSEMNRPGTLGPLAAPPAEDGMSYVTEGARRSPTGILYPHPPAPGPEAGPDSGGGPGWVVHGFLEAGALGVSGDTNAAKFREYGDWRDDPVVRAFSILAEQPEKALYVSFTGGAAGRADQYYELTAGKYGEFRFTGFFNQTPHVFATNARSLWEGVGSGRLTLPAALVPGNNTLGDIEAALAGISETTLKISREKAGFTLSYLPLPEWELFGRFASEWRDGARPFGGAFSFPSLGGLSETVEPIEDQTFTVLAGLRYLGEQQQGSLAYEGSFYRNDLASLTFENPFFLGGPGGFSPEQGRFALAPDNDSHTLRGDFGAALPWSGRATLGFSYTRMEQNDDLLPPTVNSGLAGHPASPVNLDNFNTLAALSRTSAEAKIDTLLLHGSLSAQPTPKLRLRAALRYYDEDNDTDYTALNPLTGEYGYIITDGGLGSIIPFENGIFIPGRPGDNVRFRNAPFARREFMVTLDADYRLFERTRLGLRYQHEDASRDHRQREDTREDRIRLELSNRKFSKATLRVSYEYASRGGSAYEANPFAPFTTESLPEFTARFADGPAPGTLADLRQFDVASRERHIFNARANFLLSDAMDGLISVRYEDEDYGAAFGLKSADRIALNGEWSYQISTVASVFAYYSYQNGDRAFAGINDNGPASADGSAGGPVFPLANAWTESVGELSHVAGFGGRRNFGPVMVEVDYGFSYSKTAIDFAFNTTGAFHNLFTEAEAGDGFPDQIYRSHLLQADALWTVTEALKIRFLYRFEKVDMEDFRFDGLDAQLIGNNLFLGAVPEGFTTHAFGGFVQLTF